MTAGEQAQRCRAAAGLFRPVARGLIAVEGGDPPKADLQRFEVPGLASGGPVRPKLRIANDGDERVFIGSADMMHRNLDRRIEALVRIIDEHHAADIAAMFDLAMADTTATWHLGPDAEWVRHARDENGERLTDIHDEMMRRISKRRRPTTLA